MTKRFLLTTATLLLSICTANAGTLTTLFGSNNGQDGNMFDVLVGPNPLTITGFDLNLQANTMTIEVYTKSGTWVGSDANPLAWLLVASVPNVSGLGVDVPTHVDVTPFALAGGGVSALYITDTSGFNFNYTDGTAVGNVAASNSDLSILEGAGEQYAFAVNFQPRIWNGTIYYNVGAVPEPSSALFVLSGAGLFWFRRRRQRAVR